jgi:hypothetical protein
MFTPSWTRAIPFFTTSVENREPPYLSGELPREGEGKQSKDE